MASDLRFVTFTLKMVTDLERIGDLAVNVCQRVLILCRQPRLAP
jgi:phosphate transport system protein